MQDNYFLIDGASALYHQLGESLEPEQLTVQEPVIQNESVESNVEKEKETPAPERMLAPDFAVYDRDGNEVNLSDYYGKPIVLNFWASWCGPCQMEMPYFHEKHQELGEDITFLMVNMTDGARETAKGASAFVAEKGLRISCIL